MAYVLTFLRFLRFYGLCRKVCSVRILEFHLLGGYIAVGGSGEAYAKSTSSNGCHLWRPIPFVLQFSP